MDELDDLRRVIRAARAQIGPGTAARVGRVCVSALPGTGAAVALMTGTQVWETLAATDDVAARLDEAQYTVGEGPMWDAFTSGRAVLVPDLAGRSAGRWPAFRDAVGDLDVAGLFAFPLQVGAITVGACVIYLREPVGLGAGELRRAFAVTDLAAHALIGLRDPDGRVGAESPDAGWLDDVSVDRRQVHQATGILVGQLGLSAEAAFARLRAAAFGSGRMIGEIAAQIVAGTLRLDGEPP